MTRLRDIAWTVADTVATAVVMALYGAAYAVVGYYGAVAIDDTAAPDWAPVAFLLGWVALGAVALTVWAIRVTGVGVRRCRGCAQAETRNAAVINSDHTRVNDQQHQARPRRRHLLPWLVVGVAVLVGAVVLGSVLIANSRGSDPEPTTAAAQPDPVDEIREACKAAIRVKAERQGYDTVNFTKMKPTAAANGDRGEMTGEAELVLNDVKDERYRDDRPATFTCTAYRTNGVMTATVTWDLTS